MTSDIHEQIERRRERARAEILKISNKGNHPVFSVFEVSSVSKKAYRVEIRSLDELVSPSERYTRSCRASSKASAVCQEDRLGVGVPAGVTWSVR